jgi:putative sterol carrier protein
MAVFPSRQWVEEVLKKAEASDEYREAAKDWEGDFLCIINCDEEFLADLARKEVMEGFLSFLDMMPDDGMKRYKGTPLGNLMVEKLGASLDTPVTQWDATQMSQKVAGLTADDVAGANLYFWADFWHGAVRTMTGVAPGDHDDAAFKLTGKYSVWKMLVSGQQDTMRLVMSNRLQLEGDLQYMMKRMKAVVSLSKEVLSAVPID